MVALGRAPRLSGSFSEGWQCELPPPWFLMDLLAPETFALHRECLGARTLRVSYSLSLRIVCEIGDASLSKVHEARVEVCIRDCSPSYRAISPKTFTFVVSPMLGTGLSPRKGGDAGWFWVFFWLSWKICHHFPEGEAGVL